jgi:hypothetical protein
MQLPIQISLQDRDPPHARHDARPDRVDILVVRGEGQGSQPCEVLHFFPVAVHHPISQFLDFLDLARGRGGAEGEEGFPGEGVEVLLVGGEGEGAGAFGQAVLLEEGDLEVGETVAAAVVAVKYSVLPVW